MTTGYKLGKGDYGGAVNGEISFRVGTIIGVWQQLDSTNEILGQQLLGLPIFQDGGLFDQRSLGLGLEYSIVPKTAIEFAMGVGAAGVTTKWAIRRWQQDQARIVRIQNLMREAGYGEADIARWGREAAGRAQGRLTSRARSGHLPPWPAPWSPDYPQ
jgi:hypothetical protein